MNVYSDDCHSAVKFMLDQIIDIPNLLYMGGDFNIRDAEWDSSVSSHPAAGQALVDFFFFFFFFKKFIPKGLFEPPAEYPQKRTIHGPKEQVSQIKEKKLFNYKRRNITKEKRK